MKFLSKEKENLVRKVVEEKVLPFIDEIPVPIVRLAERFGIDTYEIEMKKDDLGAIVIDDELRFIAVNSENTSNRKRFTVAHELGHYFLHGQDSQFLFKHRDVKGRAETEDEIMADYFACYTLMPEKEFNKALELFGVQKINANNIDYIKKYMSDKFKVSMNAVEALIRAREHGKAI